MIYARRAEVVAIIQEKKSKTPCKDCGESYPYYCMDFDHLDGKLKDFVIGGSYNKKGKETILTEISKCDILCAICHRIRTHNRKLSMGT